MVAERETKLPQAGPSVNSAGQSRPGPRGSGCPSYSGGGNVPLMRVTRSTSRTSPPIGETQSTGNSVAPDTKTRTWTSTTRRYNLRSLPGGRRGASGASAGCDSMRTIGDAELSRRAPVEQYATAEQSDQESDPYSPYSSSATNPSYRSSPTLSSSFSILPVDVAQEASTVSDSVPTTRSKCTRRKWTKDMNKFILRTFYQLTAMETDLKVYHIFHHYTPSF
ncbi:hypothetical protein JYU34_020144 [Plutella xylostella]|uniref:Uncharacterized protein n=1 Tax=Plutella xylostella TaxID=51655 RepID=A0ABQ7PXF4_PLUXY|nr:hypothetical protein JYU34_020144 [Plutella xylostella]